MHEKLANLEDVMRKLKAYLPQYLRDNEIDTSRNFKCINPKHNDEQPSMSCAQNPENAYCFSCGVTCDVFQAAHWLENKPISGPEFIQQNILYLAETYGVEVELGEMTEEELYRYRTYRAYKDAAELVANPKFGDYTKVNQEAQRRGWTIDVLQNMSVGTVNNKDFREMLKSMGYEARFLDEIDLGRADIFNEDSLVFTIKDEWGRPVGFAARNLEYVEDENGKPQNGSKYKNQKTTGLKCNIYQKGSRLYEIHTAIRSTPPLYVFEGYPDVITAQQHGLSNCVAVGGTAFTNDHIALLKRLKQYDIILCLDGDQAGIVKIISLLDEKFAGEKDFRVSIVVIPDGMDPDDYLRTHGADEFRKLRRLSAFQWRLSRYKDDDDPETICKVMIPHIASEPSFVSQDTMCDELSRFTGIDKRVIKDDLERVQNLTARARVREKERIIEASFDAARRNPNDAKQLLQECAAQLEEVEERYGENALSQATCISFIESQKAAEEAMDGSAAGFKLSDVGLRGLGDVLNANWKEDVFMCFGGAANSGKCLTGDARIMHAGTGELRTIEEIVCEQLPHPCLTLAANGDITSASVSAYFDEGEKETISIETTLGHKITGTFVHPVMTQRGWVQLQNLVFTDKVAIPKILRRTIDRDKPISDEEIRLLGYLISEGCLTRGCGIASDTSEVVHDFYHCVKTVFGNTVKIRVDNGDNPIRCDGYFITRDNVEATKRCIEIGSKIRQARGTQYLTRRALATKLGVSEGKLRGLEKGSEHTNCLSTAYLLKQVLDPTGALFSREDLWYLAYENPAKSMLLEYELFGKLAKAKEIPAQVFTWSNRQICLLLSAMWDCDGSYSNSRGKASIELSSASNKLVRDIQHLLLRLGVLARVRYKLVTLDEKTFDSWVVELTSNRYINMFIELTSSLAKVTQRDNITKRISNSSRPARGYYKVEESNANYYLVPLKSIKLAGLQRVYDISVPATHNFIANDIIVHNTSLCAQLAYEIASNEENDACVIYHTIDDSAPQILPRFVAQAYGADDLTLNQIRNPNWYKLHNDDATVFERRERGYRELTRLVREGRLILKDANDGSSFAFGDSLISHFQKKFPGRRIVYILDNLHKTPDYQDMDVRLRFKTLSNHMKNSATKKHVCIISTVEYTKMPPRVKPNNNNIAETRAIIYDASFIGHMYNDLHESGEEEAILVHRDRNDAILPRIRLGIGKNKITDFKGRIFLDFYPASGLFRYVDSRVAEADQLDRIAELRQRHRHPSNPGEYNGTGGEDDDGFRS